MRRCRGGFVTLESSNAMNALAVCTTFSCVSNQAKEARIAPDGPVLHGRRTGQAIQSGVQAATTHSEVPKGMKSKSIVLEQWPRAAVQRYRTNGGKVYYLVWSKPIGTSRTRLGAGDSTAAAWSDAAQRLSKS